MSPVEGPALSAMGLAREPSRLPTPEVGIAPTEARLQGMGAMESPLQARVQALTSPGLLTAERSPTTAGEPTSLEGWNQDLMEENAAPL